MVGLQASLLTKNQPEFGQFFIPCDWVPICQSLQLFTLQSLGFCRWASLRLVPDDYLCHCNSNHVQKNGNLCNSNLQAIVLYKKNLSTQLFTARVLLQTLYKSMFATNTSKNNFCHQITLRMISTCFPIQGFCYSKVDFPRFLPANIFQLNCWPHQGRGRACSRR